MAVGDASIARFETVTSKIGVDKAYILFHKKPVGSISDEEEIPKNKNGTNSTGKDDKPVKTQYAVEFEKLGSKVTTFGRGLASMFGADQKEALIKENDESEEGFIPIKVQYNPSTLQFVSREGRSYDRYSGVGGSGTFQIIDVPYEVVLNMDLIFDETVNSNAFATYDASNIGSVTGLGKSIKTGILGSINSKSNLSENAGRRYSVQAISELFVAAIAHPYTRMICVVWNKTVFWGELVGATVEYTMFNRDGDPIRSKVHIEIRKDQRFDTADTASDWEKTYDALFEAGNKLAQKSVYSSTSVAESSLGQQNQSSIAQGSKFIASNLFHI